MSEITLEKIDIIRERTGASYSEAKEALEACEGNVVDALIYIEEQKKEPVENMFSSKEEFFDWLRDLINKGNVNRIRVKKDEKVLIDIPVTAGAAAMLTALIWPPILAVGLLTAVVTKVTFEITKSDGTVEVINTAFKNTMDDVKDKVYDAAEDIKEKFKGKGKGKDGDKDENVYQYTVKFDEMEEKEPSAKKPEDEKEE
ncbi:MAG: ubiquitin-associated- protein [Firmicutes bacterium]|nr:ubiquitin-associated- protein [Bacillota bacterium]